MADKTVIKRGDIVYADLRPVVGSEQGGIRPVLIIQNNLGNFYSPTTIAVVLTTKDKKSTLPTHVTLHKNKCEGLIDDSVIMCEQIRTIDKKRIREKVGRINEESLDEVMRAVKVSINMF